MYAIISTCGRQYRVEEGDVLFLEKLDKEEGETIVFNDILCVEKDGKVTVGTPTVAKASVEAKVVKNGKSPKIKVFKFKAKKNYRRMYGHRQPYTKVQIEKIKA